MTKSDLIKTLSYYGQETTVEGDFIIGEDTIWASRNIVAEIFGTSQRDEAEGGFLSHWLVPRD